MGKVAWAHLNMISESWGFIDEPHALSLWNIVGVNAYEMIYKGCILMNQGYRGWYGVRVNLRVWHMVW